MKRLLTLCIGMLILGQTHAVRPDMVSLTDEELANTQGQALINLAYIAPGDSSNPNGNIGFYRLGMEADLQLNANIKKLQLGCGGVNGGGACDVDIDNVRFTGFVSNPNNIYNDQGPLTDFLLRNPYFEVAVRNPDSASSREIVGLRVGALEAAGMMSFGDRPYDGSGNAVTDNNPANHTGINRLSAVMDLQLNNGYIPINCTGIILSIACGFSQQSATINTNAPNTGDNIFIQQYYSRASSLNLGELKAVFSVLGYPVTAVLTEDTRFIHNVSIGSATTPGKDFYISLSSLGDNVVTDIDTSQYGVDMKPSNSSDWLKWQKLSSPNTWAAAQRGWSFAMPDVRVENFRSAAVSADVGALLGIQLNNLDVKQVPVDNCWGSLTFC